MKPPTNKVQTLLKKLPSVTEVLKELDQLQEGIFSEKQITDCVRKAIGKYRKSILKNSSKDKKTISSNKMLQKIKKDIKLEVVNILIFQLFLFTQ